MPSTIHHGGGELRAEFWGSMKGSTGLSRGFPASNQLIHPHSSKLVQIKLSSPFYWVNPLPHSLAGRHCHYLFVRQVPPPKLGLEAILEAQEPGPHSPTQSLSP